MHDHRLVRMRFLTTIRNGMWDSVDNDVRASVCLPVLMSIWGPGAAVMDQLRGSSVNRSTGRLILGDV